MDKETWICNDCGGVGKGEDLTPYSNIDYRCPYCFSKNWQWAKSKTMLDQVFRKIESTFEAPLTSRGGLP